MTGVTNASLPTGWLWVQASHVADVVTGNTPPTSDASNYGGEIPFVKPPQLVNTSISSAPETISSLGAAYARVLPVGAVLVSCIGNLGKTAILKVRAATNQQINALVFDSGVKPEFGFYYAQTMEPWLIAASSATTVAIVNKGKFESAPFPLAPVAEQTRIVEKLEVLLSDLDAGVAELKAAQKKLTRYRQSLLKAAVEGALTAEWRKHNQPTESGAQLLQRILKERRARWQAKQLAKFKEQGKAPPKDWQDKYSEPVKADTADSQALPAGWAWASVEQLGDVQLGRQRSPNKMTGENPAKYIRAANITEQGINFVDVLEMDFDERERITFALKAGDVLLTEASGSAQHVGRPVIWRSVDGLYCFQNTVIRFSPQGIGSEFAFRVFLAFQKLGKFQQLSSGVGINHLSAGKFSSMPIPLPPLAEQIAIVESLEMSYVSLIEQEAVIERALKQSAAQRKNILKAAFSGKLVPQDPNDEPASVLLARIRAERAGLALVKTVKKRVPAPVVDNFGLSHLNPERA